MGTNYIQTGNRNKINNNKTKITISIGTVVFVLVIVVALFLQGNNSFSIEGKWKNTGTEGYGVAEPGAIVSFDGKHCNFFSPSDTYAFYKDKNGTYRFDLSGLLGGSASFKVEVIDNDHMEFHAGSTVIELMRVS